MLFVYPLCKRFSILLLRSFRRVRELEFGDGNSKGSKSLSFIGGSRSCLLDGVLCVVSVVVFFIPFHESRRLICLDDLPWSSLGVHW